MSEIKQHVTSKIKRHVASEINTACLSGATQEPGLFACLYQPPGPHTSSGLRASSGSHVSSAHASSGSLKVPGGVEAEALVATAADISPRYEQHRRDLVSIDVRGLSRLFGSPRTIAEELRRGAADRGLHVHVAVAGSRIAALVLAIARPGVTVVARGDEASTLAPVAIGVLERLHEDPFPVSSRAPQARIQVETAAAAIATLKRWGLRTLGELAALPAADLASRLGRAGRLWQSIARGEDTRPLVPMQPEERFEGTTELEWPIEGSDPLSFVLTRLLEPLSTRLERRDRGAAVLHVALGLITRSVHTSRIELPSPIRDVRTLRTLALLDLEAHPPEAAIDRVTVTIEPTPGRILQHALFSRPHPTPEQLSTLLARLGAVMGQDRVGAPALVDTHRPGAFAMTPFALEHAQRPSGNADCRLQIGLALTSVLRRCRQPIPARVVVGPDDRPIRVTSDRRSFSGGGVVACAGPWRTSGAWWEREVRSAKSEVRSTKYEGRNEKTALVREKAEGKREKVEGPWNRDEWEVALSDGAVYRIFQDRVSEGWFIEGMLD